MIHYARSFSIYLLVEEVNIKELLLKIEAEKGVMYCKQQKTW